MKKLLLVFMMVLLWTGSSWAVTVQVGSGTATVAYVPVFSYYGYSYSQQIYLGSEITAGGGSAGIVTKIRFYYSSGTWNVNSSGWTIYLGNTTKTSFVSTTDWVPVGSMTQVFSGTISNPVAGTWLETTLSPTFNYTGGNLVVAVDENVTGYTGSPCYWRSFSPVGNRAIYACSDTQNPDPASPPPGTLATGINQVQFEMTLTTTYLNVVPASIAFNYIPSGGTSANQYVLSGGNLTAGPIVVTAPAGFGVSLSAGGPYSSFVNVSYTVPTLDNIPIYVQFAPTGPAANYSDNITNVGGGASINVAVTGTSIYSVCNAGATTCDEYISKVQVGTINNISACTAGGYANYTAISTNMNKGVGYAINVTDGPPNYSPDQCGIWVDWNYDGDFNDGGETINVSGTPGIGPYTAIITPPVGAVETSTRLRIRILYTGTVSPCGTTDWGEVEDYTINVLPVTSCPPPSAQTATNFSTSGADLGWTSAESFFALYIVPTGSPAPTAGSIPTVNE